MQDTQRAMPSTATQTRTVVPRQLGQASKASAMPAADPASTLIGAAVPSAATPAGTAPEQPGRTSIFKGLDALEEKKVKLEAEIKELCFKITDANTAGRFDLAKGYNIDLGKAYKKLGDVDASHDKLLKKNLSRADGVVSRKLLGYLGRDRFCDYVEAILNDRFVLAASILHERFRALEAMEENQS
jgi:hypothetical protein